MQAILLCHTRAVAQCYGFFLLMKRCPSVGGSHHLAEQQEVMHSEVGGHLLPVMGTCSAVTEVLLQACSVPGAAIKAETDLVTAELSPNQVED